MTMTMIEREKGIVHLVKSTIVATLAFYPLTTTSLEVDLKQGLSFTQTLPFH